MKTAKIITREAQIVAIFINKEEKAARPALAKRINSEYTLDDWNERTDGTTEYLYSAPQKENSEAELPQGWAKSKPHVVGHTPEYADTGLWHDNHKVYERNGNLLIRRRVKSGPNKGRLYGQVLPKRVQAALREGALV